MASDWTEASTGFQLSPLILALNSNIAQVTSIANDYGYDQIFSRQLVNSGRAGDVLLLLSVSGDSANLVRAAVAAKDIKMKVVSVLGRRGELANLSDSCAVLGENDYGLSEDLHLALAHIVVRFLNDGLPQRFEARGGLTR